MQSLASDNYAAVHPEVMAAIAAANTGHAPSYGADPITERAIAAMRAELGADAEIGFVFNGTGANVVGLQLMLHPWQHVVCARTAHINVDECGAPERLTGAKLLDLETADGKLTPDAVRAVHTGVGVEHHTQPRVVSISQSTELGTLYTAQEIRALADTAHSLDMYLHLDGARIANAAAALEASLAEITGDAGVDVMSFGGTKNGLLGGEAVVVFADELKPAFPFVRKQLMQLGSKGRFIAAQFHALFTGELWRRNALHANAMAARLHDAIADLDGVWVTQPRQANVVFATLPPEVVAPLQAVAPFYLWNEETTEARLMCSWDTTAADVDGFAKALGDLIG